MNDIERRTAQRVALSVCGEVEQEVNLSGMVHDLSAGGMAFVTDTPLDVGSALKVAFDLGNPETGANHRLETRVEVVRCDALEEESYRIASRFVDLDEAANAHLDEYLENLLVLI